MFFSLDFEQLLLLELKLFSSYPLLILVSSIDLIDSITKRTITGDFSIEVTFPFSLHLQSIIIKCTLLCQTILQKCPRVVSKGPCVAMNAFMSEIFELYQRN